MNPICSSFTESSLPCAGFDVQRGEALDGRVIPSFYRLNVPAGRYRLTVTLSAKEDAPQALLFASHRRLLWRGSLRAGQTRLISAPCMAHPFLHESSDDVQPCSGIELALAAPGAAVTAVTAEEISAPAVLLMGDSTVTDQRAGVPYAPGAAYCGWGAMLTAYLENACLGNFARSGLTVETCRTEGLYALMKTQLRPGDLVLMQFGHNDQKRPHLTAQGGYSDALRAFISDVRALGGVPVIVTPLARNSWKNEREYMDLLKAYAAAARQIAAESGVPVIDLHGFMKAHLIKTGRDQAKVLFHTGDYTHTNDFGAYLAAGFVAQELARLGLAAVKAGAPWPAHGPYTEQAVCQGDESLPPSGLEALYRGYETTRPDAPLSRQEALELVLRTCGLFAMNEPVALPADIPLDEAYSADVRCALQHGLIPGEMLADGRLRRRKSVTAEEFMTLLRAAYGMRCPTDALPAPTTTDITRAQAAAICRAAVI